ncbi:MAG TPA: AAA family ATPase [Miltoncostaeaceae bacterium]|nr:AAA family ATPase [Miltoncostaeaceae bacterium]
MSPTSEVVGRESELDSVHGFLEAVPRGPVALLIEGEIGIGKTTLWREGVADAGTRGLRVLTSRPVEAEIALPFAVLGDLLGDVPDAALGRLPDPQREALEVALLRAGTKRGGLQRRAVALGVLGALRVLAEDTPLVVAVDDAQWLDRPSADALAFAARRLRDEPVGFLLARRAEVSGGSRVDLETALDADRLTRLVIGPLDIRSLDRLLRAQLGRQFLRPALVELQRVSGGNPFFALELGRALLTRDVSPAPGEPLPVPATLNELVRERLAGVPTPAREAALVVSALSRPTVELVAAATGGGDGVAALETAAAAGVLEVADGRVRFSHPLLASVVYGQTPPARRRELHARLAEIVEDPDERALHLALAASGPDAQVAAAIEDAARRARARGAPHAAAELWDRARMLTPPDDAAASRRAIEAGDCHLEAGDTDRARRRLEDVVARLPPGRERAAALTRLAWVSGFGHGFHVSADLFRDALGEIGDDPGARIEIERGLAWSIHETGDVAAAEPHARAALELAERLGEPGVLASALADMAFFQTIRGRGVPTALIERALELEDTAAEGRSFLGSSRTSWVHGMLLAWAGDIDAARSTLTALRDTALARGDEHTLSYVTSQLSRVECLAGNWELASHYASECLDAAVQTAHEDQRPFALSTRSLVDAHLGRVAEARAATDEGLPLALDVGVVPAHLEMLAIRGFLEHSLGEAREAHRFLGPLPRAVADAGFGEPALFRFHGDAIETLLALGEHDTATALLAELEEQARATGGLWAPVIASRCRALLGAAAGDSDAAYAHLDRTLELHEHLHEPFERGRTLLVLGTLHRRNRKKGPARESLTQALAVFDDLGARLWSERTRAELRRIGGRAPATPGVLTPTEERVAALVAAGRTYREVADALFISPRTVQWNLSKIYRKLGVRSRAELAAKLAAGQTPAVPRVPE